MTRLAHALALASAALTAAILAGCTQEGGNSQGGGSANAAPATPLGPLTGQEICDRLTPATVGPLIGQEVTGTVASTAGTPQCAYGYRVGTTGYSLTVAYQRPDGDLAGNQGEAGFDHAVQQNRTMLVTTSAQEHEIQAGQRALRLSGEALHYGIVLTGGRVITVVGFTSSLSGEAIDRVVEAAATEFGR